MYAVSIILGILGWCQNNFGIIGGKKRSARKNNRKILEHNRLKPMHKCILTYTCTHIHVSIYIRTKTHVYICACIHTHAYIYVTWHEKTGLMYTKYASLY